MASTASTRLRLNKQGTGDSLDTWGSTLNTQVFDLLDEAIAGAETIALTGVNYTLSSTNYASDESRNASFRFTGTGGVSVIYPSVECFKGVRNDSSAAIIFGYSAGSGVTIPAGGAAIVQGDATTMRQVVATVSSADLSALFLATSTDTETIASSGDITFTLVESDRAFAPGMLIRAAVTASPGTNYITGYVKTYSGTTLVMTATASGGSGSYSAWTITFDQATVGLPSQTGNSGKFLKTDGAAASWDSPLPSLTSNALKFLRVNSGATASEWATVDVAGDADTAVTTATTLTSSSKRVQTAAMSSIGQAFTLPDATTLSKGGPLFSFYNSGANSYGVRDSAGTLLIVVGPGGFAHLSLYSNSTAAGGWSANGSRLEPVLVGCNNEFSSSYALTTFGSQPTTFSTLALSSTKSAHFFFNSSSQPVVAIVDHTTYPATVGTPVLIKAAGVNVIQAYALSSSKLAVILSDTTIYNVAVSGTTPTVSSGATAASFTNFGASWFNGGAYVRCMCSASLLMAVRVNGGNLTVQAVDVSGTNPSAGSEVTSGGSASVQCLTGIFPVSATSAIVVYVDDSGSAGSPYSIRAQVASTSGTTVTLNASAGLSDVIVRAGAVIEPLFTPVAAPGATSATSFVVAYRNPADDDIYAVAFTVSGTTTTAGSAVKVEAGTFQSPYPNLRNGTLPYALELSGLTSSTAILHYTDAGSNTLSRSAVLSLSGATITVGTIFYGSFADPSSTKGQLVLANATYFWTIDAANNTVRAFTISGTSITISGTAHAGPGALSYTLYHGQLSGGYGLIKYVGENNIVQSSLAVFRRVASAPPIFAGFFVPPDFRWDLGNQPIELASNKFGWVGQAVSGHAASTPKTKLIIGECATLAVAP